MGTETQQPTKIHHAAMTGTTITSAIIGFLLCAFLVCAIGLLVIFLIWWMFRKGLDFDDIADYTDDPDEL